MINHLSKTQIGMYQRCPYAYFCRYVEGLKLPPSSSILVGKSFDEAINLEYNTKIDKKKGQKVSVIQDCFADTFDREKDNIVFAENEKPEELKDLGVKCVANFHKEVCPQVNPVMVQKKDELKFENVDYTFMVVVDVVDDKDIVIDNKTTKRSWAEGREFQELDPIAYSLWYELSQGKQENKFRFDIGVLTKTPKVQQIERKVSKEEKKGFLKYIAYIYDSIQYDLKRGMFLPRQDSFLCSKKWCGYYQKCEKEWGIKIKEGGKTNGAK